ncbi:MAG: bifunctional phosphoribosylaminoimidazolecarboxamide formyltransferase/IMP cyclohydrolase, partial [Acidobacteria bacterium]|nr:bifunctional phosphoribosylaminoimidazolecarboxamide formyltransferase/IMP cyclohydrolase [Acidobacteriota bacterium]
MMTEQNQEGLRRIRRALLSVSDKTGLVEFAGALRGFGVEILSTGGTAKTLREAGIAVRDVSDVTGFPEMLDGRVKTLHPRIHGGLLALRDNKEHMAALAAHGIEPIDMVVINLYPFEQTIAREGVTLEEAVEQIDIGGPAMIRSAAKNYRDVAVVVSPNSYAQIEDELRRRDGELSFASREELALLAFAQTSAYDDVIFNFLHDRQARMFVEEAYKTLKLQGEAQALNESLPSSIHPYLTQISGLRYGENPHQQAAIYDTGEAGGITQAERLSGKEMSFNNYIDADAAWQLVCDFDETACAIIKHTNPA